MLRIEGLEPALRPGEVLALLGEGGDALVRAMAGLAPARGRLWLEGQELSGLPPHKRGLGVVLDPPGLFPQLSVAQNVAWTLPWRGRPSRVAQALAALGLSALARHRADTLAVPEAMRLGLARALALQPPVLLLENPFVGLAGEAAMAMAALLRRLGPAVVLAARDPAPALAAADRVGVLVAGALRQLAPPREVYDRPADAEVAALGGPVNRLPGVVEQVFDDMAQVRLVAGATVEVPLGAPLPPGTLCLVLVRPERLAVAAVAPEAMGDGALAATLKEARLEGGRVRLRLGLGDGSELLALRPAGLRLPAVGEFCAVAWDAGAGLVFPG